MEDRITGSTVLLGLFGSPVRHSVSPMMHNTAFRALGLDYAYLAFEIGKEELPDAVRALRTFGMRGANLTMPCKEAALPLMDRLTPAARLAGAVNTILREGDVLTGHITDGEGWSRSMREAGAVLAGQKMVLAGAGGAATAICVQAALDGVREISVFNRHPERAERIARIVSENTSCRVRAFALGQQDRLRQELAESGLLVNATRVGMAPLEYQCVIPDPAMLHPGLFVMDAIYEPAQTRLLRMAKAAGCRTLNGLGMVLYQGAASFRLWTGREMPVDVVRSRLFAGR